MLIARKIPGMTSRMGPYWGVCDNRLDPPARTPGSFRETFGHWSYANRSFLHVRGCAGMNSSWMRWLGITAVNHIDHSRMYERDWHDDPRSAKARAWQGTCPAALSALAVW